MKYQKIFIVVFIALIIFIITIINIRNEESLPIIAIANYGPHSSLDAAIEGIKEELAKNGFIENKTVRYKIDDIGFDLSLLPQMITKLRGLSPKVMVVMTSPVAQFAKGAVKDIPLIYNVVTDPVGAGLLKEQYTPDVNMTGSSDRQDLQMLLEFAKQLIPNARTIGILYSTSETNDFTLVKMMQKAAESAGMKVLAIPINQARDVPAAMQNFKGKVDFIYVGGSGQIQPTLPAIAQISNEMGIPVLNVNEEDVKADMILASFGVDYKQVGINAGKLVVQVLNGTDISKLKPIYPSTKDHHSFISIKKAEELNLKITRK